MESAWWTDASRNIPRMSLPFLYPEATILWEKVFMEQGENPQSLQ